MRFDAVHLGREFIECSGRPRTTGARSKELLAAFHGKGTTAIDWTSYRQRYLREMRDQKQRIADLAARSKSGETITLLCSSACTRESRCHRSLLKDLIDQSA